jgi:hypothetical protein
MERSAFSAKWIFMKYGTGGFSKIFSIFLLLPIKAEGGK